MMPEIHRADYVARPAKLRQSRLSLDRRVLFESRLGLGFDESFRLPAPATRGLSICQRSSRPWPGRCPRFFGQLDPVQLCQ